MWWIITDCLALPVEGKWSHLKTSQALMDIWQDSETSHSKSSLGNYQHQYLSELLVNMYSYCLMVKSVSYCYVHGSRLFLNPVTYFLDTSILQVYMCSSLLPHSLWMTFKLSEILLLTNGFLLGHISFLTQGSRPAVKSREAKKKHARAFSGLHDHYSELFTRMEGLIYKCYTSAAITAIA